MATSTMDNQMEFVSPTRRRVMGLVFLATYLRLGFYLVADLCQMV